MKISRERYARLYGPTTGDRFQLADTSLVAEIEHDYASYGDEAVFGGGKTLRDGMGQKAVVSQNALDLVITNAIVFDPLLGIVKGDVGIKAGRIVKVGKAGNPDVMDGVDPALIIGPATEVIAGEHTIVTPGGIDGHIHWIDPAQVWTALSSGITTMIGGGTGPVQGSLATTCTPGPWNLSRMLQAAEAFPVNIGFLGKGNSSEIEPLTEQILAGAMGLKLHEDWGSTPAAIDRALSAADQYDVQVNIHTDTLNEAGFVEETLKAIAGRVIHTYHTEGAGGGHAPDILRLAGEAHILPSSTNPTRPYSVNTIDEHLDMLMVCHHLNPDLPEDLAFAESRIRPETIAAEDVLHDEGILSMYASDSQAMGRVGENWQRLFQTADKMKKLRGPLTEDNGRHDNHRILRYLAKLTVNPAITHGISHSVGLIAPGLLADLVVWDIPFFAIRPKLVLKSGMVAWALSGDPSASIATPEPTRYRPMFGAYGSALAQTSVLFVSQVAEEAHIQEKLRLAKPVVSVRGVRSLSKRDMVRNGKTPIIAVDPETYRVTVDGQLASVPPAQSVSLSRLYRLF